MKNIIFVCHGNICRSVMAEYILKNYINKLNINDIKVYSRATSNEEIGNDIYYKAKECLNNHNIPYQRHYATKLTINDYQNADIVFVMDQNNYDKAIKIIKDNKKLKKLLDKDILDPWYTRDFETCYNDIDKGIKLFLKELGD